MQRISTEMHDLITGAIIFSLGLLLLTFYSKSTERLIKAVEGQLLEQGYLYQQCSNTDINLISDDELYPVIMGSSEYPVVIDGNIIDVGGNDYELYFSFIKDGYYKKSYIYDGGHKIIQIVYSYAAS